MSNIITKDEQTRLVKLDPQLTIFETEKTIPKTKLPYDPTPAEVTYRLIKDKLSDEGNARMNLATFCQTYMEPEALKIMSETMNTNAIDKSEYPQMAQIENYCVDIISDLWHGNVDESIGCSTVGSSEACQLAGMAMKFHWQKLALKANLDTNMRKPNLVISSGYQVCWEKFCIYWDIELREVPMDENHLSLNIDTVLDYVDEYTIGVVGILGITYTGKFDDIEALDKKLSMYNQTATIPVQIHVDAASGGLYVPFVNPELIWDFKLDNVRSINTSGHKYGLVYPGIGWIIWKEKRFLPEELIFNVSYLGGSEATMAINFSRSGSHIVGQYYVFMRYGHKGLEMVHQSTAHVAATIVSYIKTFDLFHFYNEGDTIPVVTFSLKETKNWTLYDLSDRLRMHGWQIPAYPMPKNLSNIIVLRFVFRADFSTAMAEQLINDLKIEIDYLEKNSLHISNSTDHSIRPKRQHKHGFTH